MRIVISSDHTGIKLRNQIIKYLKDKDISVLDVGSDKEKSNYVMQGIKVGENILLDNADLGIIICGTGLGISIAANKVRGIRAVVCNNIEFSKLSREHNDANVLALGARVITEKEAYNIIDVFIETKFLAGRHLERIETLIDYEESCIDC